jgi:hypothetical protein
VAALKAHTCELVAKDVMERELIRVRTEGMEAAVQMIERSLKDFRGNDLRLIEQRCSEKSDALQGQLLDVISERLEEATVNLISRDEVANAFAQVAAIEAQKVKEQQAEAARIAQQQARIAEVFGTVRPMTQGLDQQLAGLNEQLNAQLAGLNEQLAAIRGGATG